MQRRSERFPNIGSVLRYLPKADACRLMSAAEHAVALTRCLTRQALTSVPMLTLRTRDRSRRTLPQDSCASLPQLHRIVTSAMGVAHTVHLDARETVPVSSAYSGRERTAGVFMRRSTLPSGGGAAVPAIRAMACGVPAMSEVGIGPRAEL